ncbi:hypothetical protein CSA_021631 [Cucumis sativus]|uniref:Uncharacterized protein n=1 Tax=Cucumis sativus TaxID=3659 RepID=A0ACB6HBL9_CUCSA|nr:hypothetical protein CSA_021631 [Cucumis sativus]
METVLITLVVELTWKQRGNADIGVDPTVYNGLLGTAVTCLRSYEATGNHQDLVLCSDIVDKCTVLARASHRHLTFLCGRGGVYALGAVVSHYMRDPQKLDFFFNLFLKAAEEKALPIDLKKEAGASDNPDCPLMFRWHGTRYYGAANGLAGILQPKDKLVQWSHGATGIGITLCKLHRGSSMENGLVKEVGLADGVAGNAYAFLSLYRLTGESVYEERARAFGTYLYHNASKLVATQNQVGGDRLFSLFHGLAGTACLWFDLLEPEKSRFPGYEL